MKLQQLQTLGVRGLADSTYTIGSASAPPPNFVVVTGRPGAGTTTFLDAIAYTASRLASGGPVPDSDDVLRGAGASATIRSVWWVEDDERRYGGLVDELTQAEVSFKRGGLGAADADPGLLGLMTRYDHTGETSKVVLFPARRVSDDLLPMSSDFEAAQRMIRFSQSLSRFAGLQRALAERVRNRQVWDGVQQLFGALSPSAKLIGVNTLGQLDFVADAGVRVPLYRLSFSERNAFVFAASVVLMGLNRAVVLVDSPELGLPVGLAARWIGAMREVTPQAQWIVASRDPELIQSVVPAARIELGRGAP